MSLWRARITYGSVSNSAANLSDGSRFKMSGDHALGLTLARETEGLLIKASYLRTRIRMDLGPQFTQLKQGLAALQQLPIPGLAEQVEPLQRHLWNEGTVNYLALGTQYETGPWSIYAEGSEMRIDDSLSPGRRAYLGVGYRHNTTTLYGLVSRAVSKSGAVSTPDLASTIQPFAGATAAQQAQMLAIYSTMAANSS